MADWLVAACLHLGVVFQRGHAVASHRALLVPAHFHVPARFAVAIILFPFDRKIVRYALPLVLGGWLIAVPSIARRWIHSGELDALHAGVPTEVQIEWLGFVTIPLLSFVAFSVICAFMIVAHYRITK
jgi:disulfide bond formation protein DsbB